MYNPNDVFQKQLSQLAESYRQGTPPVLQQMGQPTVEQVKSVPGITGAREYLKNMAASSSQILMDETQNMFFLVRKDANGNPSPITVGKFTVETEPVEESPYISNGGSSFFGSDWLGAFLIIAILFGGGLGWGGNRGPAPDVATKEYVMDTVNNSAVQGQLQQIAPSSANNNFETAKLIMDQNAAMQQQNFANQINVLQDMYRE